MLPPEENNPDRTLSFPGLLFYTCPKIACNFVAGDILPILIICQKHRDSCMNDTNQAPLPPKLFHVTQRSRLKSILRSGLIRRHHGEIHGSMEIRPQEPTVYLSRHDRSNNLNTRLFDEAPGNPLVILEVDSRFIKKDRIYPDDALFVLFGQEDIFEDADEVSEQLGVDIGRAAELLDHWEDQTNDKLAAEMKDLWPWYLSEHGEISVAQDIPARAITAVRDYETGQIIRSFSHPEPGL